MQAKWWQGLLIGVGLIINAPLYAHGYQYLIQVQSSLVLNAQGELSAIEQLWRYDKPTSTLLMEDSGLKDNASPSELYALKQQLVKDLTDLAYFTELRLNGVVIPRDRVQESTLTVQQGQLLLKLIQPLAPAVKLKGELVIDMADPTGAGIPYHGQPNHVVLPTALQARCKVAIEARQSLQNLNEFEHGKPAEWVKINCAE